jgi:hypothetical protein
MRRYRSLPECNFRNVAQRQCVVYRRTFRDSVTVPFSRFGKFVDMFREDENYALSQNFEGMLHTDLVSFFQNIEDFKLYTCLTPVLAYTKSASASLSNRT